MLITQPDKPEPKFDWVLVFLMIMGILYVVGLLYALIP
jgi:hypothetical protein